VRERVHGPRQAVRTLPGVPGEVGQLAQDDVDGDGVDEPGQHGVRDEPHERACPEHSDEEHDHAGQDGQREQRRAGVRSFADLRDVRDDHGHRPGGLDRHEHRTRRERTCGSPDQVAVKTRDGVDTREQPRGEPVGHALQAQHEPGAQVPACRLPREGGPHGSGEAGWSRTALGGPGRPGHGVGPPSAPRPGSDPAWLRASRRRYQPMTSSASRPERSAAAMNRMGWSTWRKNCW